MNYDGIGKAGKQPKSKIEAFLNLRYHFDIFINSSLKPQ